MNLVEKIQISSLLIADLDEVIDTTLKSSFINQGEVCICGSESM